MALGVMFHHFIGGPHPFIQGCLTAEAFERVVLDVGPEKFLTPDEWMRRTLEGRLEPDDRCFTFDDALLSQIDIALPVLDKFGLKAFFYVYSSVFQGQLEAFELNRFFRNVHFPSVEAYQREFLAEARQGAQGREVEKALQSDEAGAYLAQFAFYSELDRRYRFIRDRVFDRAAYQAIISALMQRKNVDIGKLAATIWMNNDHLARLHREGHNVGLHSTTHPTNLGAWSREAQFAEYAENRRHLTALIGESPRSASFPSGSYNADSLDILRQLGVVNSFVSSDDTDGSDPLRQPRLDYTLYIAKYRSYTPNQH